MCKIQNGNQAPRIVEPIAIPEQKSDIEKLSDALYEAEKLSIIAADIDDMLNEEEDDIIKNMQQMLQQEQQSVASMLRLAEKMIAWRNLYRRSEDAARIANEAAANFVMKAEYTSLFWMRTKRD